MLSLKKTAIAVAVGSIFLSSTLSLPAQAAQQSEWTARVQAQIQNPAWAEGSRLMPADLTEKEIEEVVRRLYEMIEREKQSKSDNPPANYSRPSLAEDVTSGAANGTSTAIFTVLGTLFLGEALCLMGVLPACACVGPQC